MSIREEKNIANSGSALGEAIGAAVEKEVNRILDPIARDNNCTYITAGPPHPRTAKPTQLLVADAFGNDYRIDSLIVNQNEQPLVLIESKYIRYTKHNRDKGSWVCTAHSSLRRTYPTIRMSIAVIVGSWSESSKELMKSFGVTLFEVGFQKVVNTLSQYNVDISWEEKEKERAKAAWESWRRLEDDQYDQIAKTLLTDVEPDLRNSLKISLDTTISRTITEFELSMRTNIGEQRRFTFSCRDEVSEFLNKMDDKALLENEDGPTIRRPEKKQSKRQSNKQQSKKEIATIQPLWEQE